jgi:hypothetical protein
MMRFRNERTRQAIREILSKQPRKPQPHRKGRVIKLFHGAGIDLVYERFR